MESKVRNIMHDSSHDGIQRVHELYDLYRKTDTIIANELIRDIKYALEHTDAHPCDQYALKICPTKKIMLKSLTWNKIYEFYNMNNDLRERANAYVRKHFEKYFTYFSLEYVRGFSLIHDEDFGRVIKESYIKVNIG
jgi:hypothetical protein